MKVRTGGIETNFQMTGKGTPLTLIHGAGDNMDVWSQQLEEFNRHYLVIRYDLRGHGQSDAGTEGYSLDLLAEDLRSLLTALRIRQTHIVGHDLGAAVGLKYSSKYSRDVKGLAIAHSDGGLGPVSETRQQMDNWIEKASKNGSAEVLAEHAESFFTQKFMKYEDGVIERYKSTRQANPARSFDEALRLQAEPDAIDYPRVVCPTFALIGADDPIVPPESMYKLQHHIVGLWFQTVATGHVSHIERPVYFNDAVMGFLRGEAARYDIPPAGYHSVVYQAAELG